MVLLLFVLAVIFLRNGGLKFSHAIVCLLLGFYLASTSMAPTIHSGLTATADIVSSLRP
ncbi:putative membrane protein [Streptomyces viridochromogenes Tue57]|uniref:Putative membrane protein n=1 Tax=Streptomyces viridochromogenes Tue57 TaxID=1160705 RepID=L8P4V0_STRVR|nr:putative membrane protein [Streptomyces viridochromogenes Tue57]